MSHEAFDSQAAAYVLGALDPAARAEFEAHRRRGCARCEATLRRAEVLTERRNLRRAWRRWSAATAAAMVVGGLLVGGWVAARYEARLGQAARELSALRERVVAEQAIVVLLRDPATQVVALRGLGPSPAARGRVIWHETAGGRLVVANLSPAPAGKIYEVWTIRGGAPGPAGVFQVDARGEAVHRIAPAGGPVDVFAVTLEPAGGGPAPTGPMVLASR